MTEFQAPPGADAQPVNKSPIGDEGWTHSEQIGPPGSCYLAQVFDPEGNCALTVEPSGDPAIATRVAQICAEALEAKATPSPVPAPEPFDSRGPTTLEGWRSAALAGEKERDYLRERLKTVDRHQGKDCWYWQNDGEDHLESMTNALPVVIRADHLRELLKGAQAPAEGDEFGEFEDFASEEGELMALPNAWAKDRLSGEYVHASMRMAWRAWKARAARANVQPKGKANEEALIDLINSHLTGFYWCGRVWEAWNVGTMGEDDFTPAEETEFASGLAADVLKLLGTAAQSPAPAPAGPDYRPLKTSAEGRQAVERFFVERLKRHDFTDYIRTALAADFACVLGGYLTNQIEAPAVQAGKEQPTYAQIRMRAELLGRQHLRTDAEVHCLAERAGFKWIEPDGDEDGFPGGFDMSDFKHMRRLVDSLTVDCQSCDGSGMEECGDPETGSVIENCGSCNGTGRAALGEAQPPVQGTGQP